MWPKVNKLPFVAQDLHYDVVSKVTYPSSKNLGRRCEMSVGAKIGFRLTPLISSNIFANLDFIKSEWKPLEFAVRGQKNMYSLRNTFKTVSTKRGLLTEIWESLRGRRRTCFFSYSLWNELKKSHSPGKP